jgi:hypothetical protein
VSQATGELLASARRRIRQQPVAEAEAVLHLPPGGTVVVPQVSRAPRRIWSCRPMGPVRTRSRRFTVNAAAALTARPAGHAPSRAQAH